MEILLFLYLGGSVLLAVLSLPLIFRKIKPNPIYGFRVPQTLNNPEVWYAANSYAGKWFLAVAILFGLAAIGLYFIPGLSVDAYALACLGVFAAAFGVGLVQCARFLRALRD